MESMNCIPMKLIILQAFIDENPEWIDKIVFILIGISCPERGDDFEQTKVSVNTLVLSINQKYKDLIYFKELKEGDMKLHQRLALHSISDILFITAARFLISF